MTSHRIPGGRRIDPAKLRAARERKEMHRGELAAASGVSVGMIAGIEQGARNGSIETLRLLADALHVTIGHLLTGGDGDTGQLLPSGHDTMNAAHAD